MFCFFNLSLPGQFRFLSGLVGARFESGDVLNSFSRFSYPIEIDPSMVLLILLLFELLSVAPPDLDAPLELSILSLALAEFESLEREEDRDRVFSLSAPILAGNVRDIPRTIRRRLLHFLLLRRYRLD